MHATVVGLDLAKNVFQIAVSHRPGVVSKDHRVRRAQLMEFFAQLSPATVVMEACGSAHYWARRLRELGHEPVLLPARLVRPYVSRAKTDLADAHALLEAFRNQEIRPVPVKTVFQQVLASYHRDRQSVQHRRTEVLNEVRGCLREHGVFLPAGSRRVLPSVRDLVRTADPQVPVALHWLLTQKAKELEVLESRIEELSRQIVELSRSQPLFRRYQTIPGIGPLSASALITFPGDLTRFASGRHFAAYLGLTPRVRASGEKVRQGKISKQGDKYLRYLLVHGARSVLSHAPKKADRDRLAHFADRLDQRKPRGQTIVAVANKLARIVWAVHFHERGYQAQPPGGLDAVQPTA